MTAPTFDPAPLLRQVELSTARVAEALGTSRRQVQRWRAGQQMYARTAERLAERVGFLPYDLWPEWHDVQVAILGKSCPSCDLRFVPKRKSQKYCSDRCREREAQRRYRSTAAGRERMREQRKAFYAQCADYQRAWRRAYYAQNAEHEKARERDRYHARKAA